MPVTRWNRPLVLVTSAIRPAPKQAGQVRRKTPPRPVPERAGVPAGWLQLDAPRAKLPAMLEAGNGYAAAATVQRYQHPEAHAAPDPQAEEAAALAADRAA